jgi:hypothetical protein
MRCGSPEVYFDIVTCSFVRPRALALIALLAVPACRIETRPPTGAARSQATVQAAVQEHYRVQTSLSEDSTTYTATRQQVELRRDLASVWATVGVRTVLPDSVVQSTRTEHLLLRKSESGWLVLSATPAQAP